MGIWHTAAMRDSSSVPRDPSCSASSALYTMHRLHHSCLSLQVLEHEGAYLADLPSAEMYEKSYMHRDNITHVEAAPGSEFIITGSADGHVKFWKKKAKGIEFAKHFQAHLNGITGELPDLELIWRCIIYCMLLVLPNRCMCLHYLW